jgi:hypothetical protein
LKEANIDLMHEQISLNGAPVIGFGAPIVTNVPSSVIAGTIFALVVGGVGAGIGYLVDRRTGAIVGAVVGGVVGGALGWWGTKL